MGKEFKLRCHNFNQETALHFIQRRFVVVPHASVFGLFLTVPDENPPLPSLGSTWPPVFIVVEADGFYYCDNLSAAAEAALIFKQLIDFLLSTNEEIRVVEL